MEINNIEVCNIYNYNKTGIQLGIKKKEKVIIEIIRGRIKFSIIIIYESYTLKECISADSDIVPPLLILKRKIY